jgi:hypothetical protein
LGPQGRGGFSFVNTTGGSISIEKPNHADYIVIENLAIEGPGRGTSIGLDLSNAGIIIVRQSVIRRFGIGVYGKNTFSAWFVNNNVSGNFVDNFRLEGESNSWRVRDGIVSQAGVGNNNCDVSGGCYGVRIDSGNDVVIDGVRFESNKTAAILARGAFLRVNNNRFERNGTFGHYVAVRIEKDSRQTMLLGNYYSSDRVDDRALDTVRLDGGSPVK